MMNKVDVAANIIDRQSCNAAKRIIVTESVAKEFIGLFLAECAKLPVLYQHNLQKLPAGCRGSSGSEGGRRRAISSS